METNMAWRDFIETWWRLQVPAWIAGMCFLGGVVVLLNRYREFNKAEAKRKQAWRDK